MPTVIIITSPESLSLRWIQTGSRAAFAAVPPNFFQAGKGYETNQRFPNLNIQRLPRPTYTTAGLVQEGFF